MNPPLVFSQTLNTPADVVDSMLDALEMNQEVLLQDDMGFTLIKPWKY